MSGPATSTTTSASRCRRRRSRSRWSPRSWRGCGVRPCCWARMRRSSGSSRRPARPCNLGVAAGRAERACNYGVESVLRRRRLGRRRRARETRARHLPPRARAAARQGSANGSDRGFCQRHPLGARGGNCRHRNTEQRVSTRCRRARASSARHRESRRSRRSRRLRRIIVEPRRAALCGLRIGNLLMSRRSFGQKQRCRVLIRAMLSEPREEALLERVAGAWTPTSTTRLLERVEKRGLRDSRCRPGSARSRRVESPTTASTGSSAILPRYSRDASSCRSIQPKRSTIRPTSSSIRARD
jgi:hypothetical protein